MIGKFPFYTINSELSGDKKESAKFYMRQKYVNWLESEHLNYVQQVSDTFQMQIECGFLGVIRRLLIGKLFLRHFLYLHFRP
jgi:hypothetical protein